MFEQAFKNIEDILRKEAGCGTRLDYVEQTSWLLFLKYLDGLQQDRATEAELEGKKPKYILDKQYRWEEWAAPKSKDGTIDHNKAATGDDLRDFVNQKLFPYLHGFKKRASGPDIMRTWSTGAETVRSPLPPLCRVLAVPVLLRGGRRSGSDESPTSSASAGQTPKPRKLTYKEHREFDGMEALILAAEERKSALEASLADPATYQKAGDSVAGMRAELEQLTAEVDRLYAGWQELESLCGRA